MMSWAKEKLPPRKRRLMESLSILKRGDVATAPCLLEMRRRLIQIDHLYRLYRYYQRYLIGLIDLLHHLHHLYHLSLKRHLNRLNLNCLKNLNCLRYHLMLLKNLKFQLSLKN